MDSIKNKNLSDLARSLRKNMTRHERHLWYDFLKGLPVMVHRQKVIELDGSQHYSLPGKQSDAVRDAFLAEQGLTVLRYANSDVDGNFPGVCEDILAPLQSHSPS